MVLIVRMDQNVANILSYMSVSVVPQCNVMHLGRCNVAEPKTVSLTLTNHSDTDSVRFQWPQHSAITFSPRLGHLHPRRSKVSSARLMFSLKIIILDDEEQTVKRQKVSTYIAHDFI